MVSMCGLDYSCSTSTTSRPLYCPQCGHTRWGSLGSWQFGHSDRPDGLRASCARRVLVRWCECLRLGFGISLPSTSPGPGRDSIFNSDSVLQVAQRSPAIVCRLELTIAGSLVPVLAADRADPLTNVTAYPLHRQGQQHLFAKN